MYIYRNKLVYPCTGRRWWSCWVEIATTCPPSWTRGLTTTTTGERPWKVKSGKRARHLNILWLTGETCFSALYRELIDVEIHDFGMLSRWMNVFGLGYVITLYYIYVHTVLCIIYVQTVLCTTYVCTYIQYGEGLKQKLIGDHCLSYLFICT